MTRVLQSGQHPDADQLSAFVEHALPPHEQQQMLAHLAVCPDCREIAFLAQSAIIEETAANLRPIAARMPWYSRWNLALPVGLAAAFLVILSFHLRNVVTVKNDGDANNTARVDQTSPLSQPTPPTQQALPSKPIPAPIRTAPATTGLPTNASTSGSEPYSIPIHPEPKQSTLNGSLAGRQGVTPATPNQTIASRATFGDQTQQIVAGAGFRPATPALAAPASAPAAQPPATSNVDAVHKELRSSAPQYNSTTVTSQSNLNQAFQAAPSPPPPPPAPAAANETVTVTDAPPLLETDSDASSEVISARAVGALTVPTLKMKKQPSLPSHLPALSTLSNARQQLAIDTDGSLFRSEDAGVSWQHVAAQWTGRAVKLRFAAAPSTQSLAKSANSAAGTVASKLAQPAQAQPTFELTNDTGIVWISTDGQTWKRK